MREQQALVFTENLFSLSDSYGASSSLQTTDSVFINGPPQLSTHRQRVLSNQLKKAMRSNDDGTAGQGVEAFHGAAVSDAKTQRKTFTATTEHIKRMKGIRYFNSLRKGYGKRVTGEEEEEKTPLELSNGGISSGDASHGIAHSRGMQGGGFINSEGVIEWRQRYPAGYARRIKKDEYIKKKKKLTGHVSRLITELSDVLIDRDVHQHKRLKHYFEEERAGEAHSIGDDRNPGHDIGYSGSDYAVSPSSERQGGDCLSPVSLYPEEDGGIATPPAQEGDLALSPTNGGSLSPYPEVFRGQDNEMFPMHDQHTAVKSPKSSSAFGSWKPLPRIKTPSDFPTRPWSRSPAHSPQRQMSSPVLDIVDAAYEIDHLNESMGSQQGGGNSGHTSANNSRAQSPSKIAIRDEIFGHLKDSSGAHEGFHSTAKLKAPHSPANKAHASAADKDAPLSSPAPTPPATVTETRSLTLQLPHISRMLTPSDGLTRGDGSEILEEIYALKREGPIAGGGGTMTPPPSRSNIQNPLPSRDRERERGKGATFITEGLAANLHLEGGLEVHATKEPLHSRDDLALNNNLIVVEWKSLTEGRGKHSILFPDDPPGSSTPAYAGMQKDRMPTLEDKVKHYIGTGEAVEAGAVTEGSNVESLLSNAHKKRTSTAKSSIAGSSRPGSPSKGVVGSRGLGGSTSQADMTIENAGVVFTDKRGSVNQHGNSSSNKQDESYIVNTLLWDDLNDGSLFGGWELPEKRPLSRVNINKLKDKRIKQSIHLPRLNNKKTSANHSHNSNNHNHDPAVSGDRKGGEASSLNDGMTVIDSSSLLTSSLQSSPHSQSVLLIQPKVSVGTLSNYSLSVKRQESNDRVLLASREWLTTSQRQRIEQAAQERMDIAKPIKAMFAGPVVHRGVPPADHIKKLQVVYERGLRIHQEREVLFQPTQWRGNFDMGDMTDLS